MRTVSVSVYVQEEHGRIMSWWVIAHPDGGGAGELYDEDLCVSPKERRADRVAVGAAAFALSELVRPLLAQRSTV